MDGSDNWEGVENGKLSYALSLVRRMASVFFGIKFEIVVVMMERQMLSIPFTTSYEAEDLIRSFVTYLADRVHKDRPINTFILLIDEASAMEEHILKRYPDCKDVTSCARSALLDKDIIFNGGAFKTALGISSLSVDPIKETTSNRAIKALILPSQLSKTDIVKEIWNKGNRLLLSKRDSHRLELVAATVNNNPRLVEIVKDYIDKCTIDKQSDSLTVDKNFAEGLYNHLHSQITSRYGGIKSICPSPQLLGALIFEDGVNYDLETADCITCSVITNSLDAFSQEQRLRKLEMSLAMMQYVTSRDDSFVASAISGGIMAIIGHVAVDENEG